MNHNMMPQGEGSGLKIPILFGIVIALLASNVYLFLQVDRIKADLAKSREAILDEVSTVRETSSMSTQTSRKRINTLQDEIAEARRQAAAAAGQAKVDAQKHADQLSEKLAEEQKKAQAQTQAAISEVAQTANTKIGEVSTEVGNVKKDVSATKSELDKTISSLSRVTGDLGVTSGLVATNSKELSALKALGDRNYYEFNLPKTKAPLKLADITVLLKRADPKRNRYTVEMVADDKKFEKKDKNVNEPVQFYMSKYRQPYEFVVNEVQKDKIIGYLAQPKVQASRNE
jgi:hypothetical protein